MLDFHLLHTPFKTSLRSQPRRIANAFVGITIVSALITLSFFSNSTNLHVIHHHESLKQSYQLSNFFRNRSFQHHSPNSVAISNNEIRKFSPISVVVLFHDEYSSMKNTLSTCQSGLLPHISDIVFFLNGVPDSYTFFSKLPILETLPWKSITSVYSSKQNLHLGIAIIKMVRLAKYHHVLLLEKDWALIEPSSTVCPMLRTSIRLLDTFSADVVRFRHRHRPGAPLHARIMNQGREEQIIRQKHNSICYMHHWVEDPVTSYPSHFRVCPNIVEDDQFWCSPSKYCLWSNNPSLFLKKWFLENLGQGFEQHFNHTMKNDPLDPTLDLKYYTNWKFDK